MRARSRRISESTIRRLSRYLRALEELERGGGATVSSHSLARMAGTTAAQVRKDLSSFGSFGTRGLGYGVVPLRTRIEKILGLGRRWHVMLVGAGRLGSALFGYPHFRTRGFEFVAIVDRNPEKIGRRWKGVSIDSVQELDRVVRDRGVEVAILTVPAEVAQEVADQLARAGVRAILNFAPVELSVPEGVVVNDVNLVTELEAVSFQLEGQGAGRWEEA